MSWTGRLNFLPIRGLTAASTAVCVCAGWQPVFAANSPQKDNDAAQMKLKYAAVDSPRLAKLDGTDIFTAISKETAASASLKINSSTLDSPALANVVTEKTTDNSTTSEEEETAASDGATEALASTIPTTSEEKETAASDDATEASASSTIPTTSEEKETAASDDATEASASSTIPTTSEEIKDSNSITESSTAVDDENKPEPLGFGDCDPYEPHDYYVDPSEPDEDTEVIFYILQQQHVWCVER